MQYTLVRGSDSRRARFAFVLARGVPVGVIVTKVNCLVSLLMSLARIPLEGSGVYSRSMIGKSSKTVEKKISNQ